MDSFVFPEHSLPSVTKLKLSRCAATAMTFEDNAMTEGEELEISGNVDAAS